MGRCVAGKKNPSSRIQTSFKILLVAGCFMMPMTVKPASATAPTLSVPGSGDDSASTDQGSNAATGPFDFINGIGRSQTALGNMWGVRPWLSQYGISFGLSETSEVLGNVSGGIHQGFDYDGLTQMALQLDTQRAFGLYGGTFNISALQIHGRNLSQDNLGTLQTASGIESDRATRLWELWYDQKFLDEDRMDLKIGQQSLDQEYMVSQSSNLFVNTMAGWPMLPSADLPGGGPAYPLSALGVRLRGKPTNSVTLLGGIYNGAPTPVNSDFSQEANASGAKFPLDGGILAIAEIQYAYPALGSMVSPDDGHALSGVYKLGFWYDSENFSDERIDNTGLSLADPGSSGIAEGHHGDYAIYAIADQMVWQSEEAEEADRTINAFARVMGTPQTDRNLIDFSANFGLAMHEPIEHRDDDTAGIEMGYAHVSNHVAQLEEDVQSTSATYTAVQSSETFIEATYQYELTPWWIIQPDVQYTFNPGGGIVDNAGNRVKNETVLGVRTIINF